MSIKDEVWEAWLEKYKCKDDNWKLALDVMIDLTLQKVKAKIEEQVEKLDARIAKGIACNFVSMATIWESEIQILKSVLASLGDATKPRKELENDVDNAWADYREAMETLEEFDYYEKVKLKEELQKLSKGGEPK